MTDETTIAQSPAAEAPAVEDAALAKAIANGYVEPAPPPRDERVKTLVFAFEHAKANNAPVTAEMLEELKALLFHSDGV